MTESRSLQRLTTLALVLVVGLPVLMVVLQAIFPEVAQGRFGQPFAALTQTLSDPVWLELTGNTLKLGVGVVLASLLLGAPLGVIRGACRLPGAALWDLLMLTPFLIPPYMAAMAWTLLLQPNGYLQQLTGIHLADLLFSVPGVVLVMTLNVFPVVYFAVSRSVGMTNNRLLEAARTHGAGPTQAFLRVTLPLTLPALAASLLLVFAMSIEEYGTPAVLAANADFPVLVTGIETRLSEWPIDLPGAAILSMVLVGLALLAFHGQRKLLRHHDFAALGGKPAPMAQRSLGRWRWPVLIWAGVVAGLATLAPLATILATSFTRTLSGGLSANNATWQHYQHLLAGAGEAADSLMLSLGLGLAAAVLAGALGLAVAWCATRTRGKQAVWLDALSLLPNTLPGVVVAVGFILFWNHPWLPATVYHTVWVLLLAYVCLLLPYPVRYANGALRQVSGSLEAAARVHGANTLQALWHIVLPLVMPALLASMVMVFAVASRELVASLLLAPAGVQTVSVYIWRQFEQGSLGAGMAAGFTTIVLTGSCILLAMRGLRRYQQL